MSISSALNAGVSGLVAQGQRIASISDNISNINTTGYKSTDTSFSTLVGSGLGAGGVSGRQKRAIDRQGLIAATGNSTDAAISGAGFFVVNRTNDSTGDYLYTRAGSFERDSKGYLKNASGFFLHGWKLDNEGRIPGVEGNIQNTKSSALLESTEAVNVANIGGVAAATTLAELGLNLDASEKIYPGAGLRAEIPAGDVLNRDRPSDSIILPTAFSLITVGDTFRISTGGGLVYNFTYGGFRRSADITTGILGATTVTGVFTGATTGDRFTINTASSGTVTFEFNSTSPNPALGKFNSLQSLADSINEVNGLTARTDGANFLYVSGENADEAITFADVQGTFAAALNLTNLAAGLNRFNTLGGLSAKVAASPGLLSNVEDGTSDAKVNLKVNNPLETISYASVGVGNFLTLFGLTAGPHGPVYNAAGIAPGENMASGKIVPQFSRNIRLFDALGTGHDFRVGFIKSANNTWLSEVWAVNKSEIVTLDPNGQVANGTITFNGDGSLRATGTGLTNEINITWANGAAQSKVKFDFGTAGQPLGTIGATIFGQTNGLSQFDGPYNVRFARANGAETGNLRGIEFTEDGFIVANYSNGQSLKVYKLPLADFTNINGLGAVDGNVYVQTAQSGEFNLKEAGIGGVGKISPNSLENTDVELAAELTKMIQTQRFYQANTKVITTSDNLLEDLQRIGN